MTSRRCSSRTSRVEAYNLGRANPDQLGSPIFDFFYGIAAIDAGHAGEGVLALERYLLSFPDNRSARFQLARGYYVLGEDQRARDEFQQLLADATGSEKTTAERYLDAIKAREGRYQPTATGYLEAGLGYDTNINSGIPGGSTFSMPGGFVAGVVTELRHGEMAEDTFGTLPVACRAPTRWRRGSRPSARPVSTAASTANQNFDQFDQLNYGGSGGVSFLTDRNLYKVGSWSLPRAWSTSNVISRPSASLVNGSTNMTSSTASRSAARWRGSISTK